MNHQLKPLADSEIINLFFDSDAILSVKKGIWFLKNYYSDMIKAYYQNGISIVGRFQNDTPIGNCIVSFTEQNVECHVGFTNGKRSGLATYTYDNGLVVDCVVEEKHSTLCKSIVPYTRNYYNLSALCIGDNTFTIKQIRWDHALLDKGKEEGSRWDHALLDKGKEEGLRWLLENFDVGQRHIRFDLTGNFKKKLPEEYQFWASNPEFSRLEQVILCAQKIIKRDSLHYLLPSIPKLSNLITFLPKSAEELSKPAIDTVVKLFTDNASVIFSVLQCCPSLRSLQLIAVPRSDMIFGDPKNDEEMGRFYIDLNKLKQLTEVIVESRHCYSSGSELECFLINSLLIVEELQIERLILKGRFDLLIDLNDVEVNLERLDLVHHCERLELLHIKDCMKIKSITINNGTLPNCQELKIISRISRLA